jgi:hypothetical protein
MGAYDEYAKAATQDTASQLSRLISPEEVLRYKTNIQTALDHLTTRKDQAIYTVLINLALLNSRTTDEMVAATNSLLEQLRESEIIIEMICEEYFQDQSCYSVYFFNPTTFMVILHNSSESENIAFNKSFSQELEQKFPFIKFSGGLFRNADAITTIFALEM